MKTESRATTRCKFSARRCTDLHHRFIKANRERYEAATVLGGYIPDAELGDLEIRNCRACGSTLADGSRRIP